MAHARPAASCNPACQQHDTPHLITPLPPRPPSHSPWFAPTLRVHTAAAGPVALPPIIVPPWRYRLWAARRRAMIIVLTVLRLRRGKKHNRLGEAAVFGCPGAAAWAPKHLRPWDGQGFVGHVHICAFLSASCLPVPTHALPHVAKHTARAPLPSCPVPGGPPCPLPPPPSCLPVSQQAGQSGPLHTARAGRRPAAFCGRAAQVWGHTRRAGCSKGVSVWGGGGGEGGA